MLKRKTVVLTQLRSLRAVDAEGQITLFVLGIEVVEDHSVWAKLFDDGSVSAFVILVALVGVGKKPVWFGTVLRQSRIIVLYRRRSRAHPRWLPA